MRKVLAVLCIVVFSLCAFAAMTVNPNTVKTGLRWDNTSSGTNNYAGTTMTTSGSVAQPTWSIIDANGYTQGTISTSGASTYTAYGQIVCSAGNTVCIYNAPSNSPPMESATIRITDGTTTLNVPLTFVFHFGLNKYWTHHARVQQREMNIPRDNAKMQIAGANPAGSPRLQSEWLIFDPLWQNVPSGSTLLNLPSSNGTDQILEMRLGEFSESIGGVTFPATGGSLINRPTFTYDGKYFLFLDQRCQGGWCDGSTSFGWARRMDGTDGTFLFGSSSGSAAIQTYQQNYMVAYAKPNWIIHSDKTYGAGAGGTTNIYVTDISSYPLTKTAVATYTHPNSVARTIFSYPAMGAGSLYMFDDGNQTPGGSVYPNIYIYDLASCETSLVAGCSNTPAYTVSLHQTFTTGWDEGGNLHCTTIDGGAAAPNCETHTHDMYMDRTTCGIKWIYGPFGSPGESLIYKINCDGTGAGPAAPNQSSDVPYWGHPAVTASNLVLFDGRKTCTASGNSCTNNNYGDWVYDPRTGQTMSATSGAGTYGHAAADGFDDHALAYDVVNTAADGKRHWYLRQVTLDMNTYTGTSTVYGSTLIDAGNRAYDNGGNPVQLIYNSPVQSPDTTLVGSALKESFTSITNISISEVGNASGGSATYTVSFPTGNTSAYAGANIVITGFTNAVNNGTFLCPSSTSTTLVCNNAAAVAETHSATGIPPISAPFLSVFAMIKSPAPPVRLRQIGTSNVNIGWTAASLNHETEAYHVFKQASCSGSWSRVADVTANYTQNITTKTEYTSYTDTLSSGATACYGVTSSDNSGVESDHLSSIVQVTNTAGIYAGSTAAAEGRMKFDTTAPANVTSLLAAVEPIGTPGQPSTVTTTTTGGTISAGTYLLSASYCNFKDSPANTVSVCTPKGTTRSVTVSGTTNKLDFNLPGSNMWGQSGWQLWVSNDAGVTYYLQSCSGHPSTYVPTYPTNSNGTSLPCTMTAFSTATSGPPAVDNTIAGYYLTWTKSSDDGAGQNDVRGYMIFYNEGSAPTLSNRVTAQSQVIGFVGAGTQKFLDYTPNIALASTSIFYGIATVDRNGNRSAGACVRGDGTTVACQ